MTRAVFLYPLSETHRARLRAAWPHDIDFIDGGSQEAVDELEDEELEVIIGDFVPTDLTRVPRLRWLQYTGAGVDDLAARAPWRQGIQVTTASGVNALAIGEYVLGALLLIAGRWRERVEASRGRRWVSADEHLAATSLRGRTLGIAGYGSVGREVARLAVALGMRLRAGKRDPAVRHDPGYAVAGSGDPQGRLPEAWYGMDELDRLAASSDYLLVSMPLTEATRHIVDARVLARLSGAAWLINVGRGQVIDEPALVAALQDGRIGGAILDVASEEPLPDSSPLWTAPRTIITPHVSGASPRLWSGLVDLFAENLGRYSRGEELLNVVDPVAAY